MTFKVLLRDHGHSQPSKQFRLITLASHSKEEAWECLENEFINSDTQYWLLTQTEFNALKRLTNNKTRR